MVVFDCLAQSIKHIFYPQPAVVAWFMRASTFSFSRLLRPVNGGLNPAQGIC